MTRQALHKGMLAAAVLFGATGAAMAQGAPVQVTGAEIQGWFASDQMAVAGFSLANRCHWLTKGPLTARSQTVYCPNSAPFTVLGEGRIEGDQLCAKFSYPDGNKFDACQVITKVGDNKYEARVNGVLRNVFYRLVP